MLRYVAVGLIVLGLVRLVLIVSTLHMQNDFSHYYLGGWMYSQGLNAYTEPLADHCARWQIEPDPSIPFAAHPPLILAMFGLLSNLEPTTAYVVWGVAQFVIFAGFVEVTRRILGWRWNNYAWLVVLAFFCNTTSVQRLFHYSQVQALVGLVMYSSLLLHLRRKRPLACALITFAAAFKIYPVVLLPWFAFAKLENKSDFVKRVAAMASVTALTLLATGTQVWIDFVTIGVPELAKHATTWTNVSVQNLVMLVHETISGTQLGDWVGAWSVITAKQLATVASLTTIMVSYLTIRFRHAPSRIAFCILLAAAAVGGVITWSHYMTLLFLPVALLWKFASRLESKPTQLAAFLAGGLVLMPRLDSLCQMGDSDSLGRVLLQFYPLFAVAAVSCLLLTFTATYDRKFESYSRIGS